MELEPVISEFADCADYVSVNGELYFLLKDERLYELKRICSALWLIWTLLSNKNLELKQMPNSCDMGAALEFPLMNLDEILNEINSFKFA